MKTWYSAVCDEHKEFCHILVNNPSCGAHYLSKYDRHIQQFLSDHYGCGLRLIHLDSDLDFIHDNEYENVLKVEVPHPMFCVQHGGSPACEESNKGHGFICPRCDPDIDFDAE